MDRSKSRYFDSNPCVTNTSSVLCQRRRTGGRVFAGDLLASGNRSLKYSFLYLGVIMNTFVDGRGIQDARRV